MRYDSEHKERTRQRVLTEAAAAIRVHGPDGIGVASLMSKAGLTHGGFYAHFKSKDDLVAQAITQMFEESRQRLIVDEDDSDPIAALSTYIDRYLSTRHRDTREHGCPLPSLSGEVARMPAVARKRFTEGVEALTRTIGKRVAEIGIPHPERFAASLLAEMVGAMALARAIADPAASDRILKASREALKGRLTADHKD